MSIRNKILVSIAVTIFASTFLLATNEIKFAYDSTGDPNLYVIISTTTDANVWDVDNAAWASPVDVNEPNYALDMSLVYKDSYRASFPTGITTAGIYPVKVYKRAGADPNIDDDRPFVGDGQVIWDGSKEITVAVIDTVVDAILVDTTAGAAGPWTSEVTPEDIRSEMDANSTQLAAILADTNAGGAGPWTSEVTPEDIRSEMDANSTQLATIVADTNELKSAVEDQNDITVAEIFAKTGITAGGTWTFANIIKYDIAWALGKWQDKSGSPGTYEVLDAEDGNTVVIEVDVNETSAYKEVTIP